MRPLLLFHIIFIIPDKKEAAKMESIPTVLNIISPPHKHNRYCMWMCRVRNGIQCSHPKHTTITIITTTIQ